VKLTLEDIGRLAGVSRSTVSRVINDQDSVSPDARHRVQEVIRRTGFSPNAAARSLASNKTGVLGLIIPSRVHTLFDDPYFGRLIQGITRASNQAGTTLSLFLFENEQEEEEVYPRVVMSGMVDGLILTASRMDDPLLDRLEGGSLPFVMVGRPDRPGEISYVDADNVGGARAAAQHLCDLGYERIGYLGAPMSTTAGVDRHRGFVDGLTAGGRTLDPHLRSDGDFSEISGYRAMQEIIAQRPEAVFIASDTMALGALRALRDAHIEVPGDVAIVSFDDLPAAQTSDPPLTTVRQPMSTSGFRAVRVLIELMTGDASEPVTEVLPTELIVRDSCGSRRATSGLTSPEGSSESR
jgi:LacI family transcriptional regulator